MRYSTGETPAINPNRSETAQSVTNGLREQIDADKARLDEKKADFYNTKIPLCQQAEDESDKALQAYRKQKSESEKLLFAYNSYKDQLEELQWQQKVAQNKAMSKYSDSQRAARDKAGMEASSPFDDRIKQLKEFMAQGLESYNLQEVQTGLASDYKSFTRSNYISATNDVISTGFSLSSEYMDLGKKIQQLGFFEGMV